MRVEVGFQEKLAQGSSRIPDKPAFFAVLGSVRIEHVHAAMGDQFNTVDRVRLLILDPEGLPGIGEVGFILKKGGRGWHRLFSCPGCGKPRGLLFPDGKGGIGCPDCTGARTTQQMNNKNTGWNKGDELEDKIIRALNGRGHISQAGMRKIKRDALKLLQSDLRKIDNLSLRVAAALGG